MHHVKTTTTATTLSMCAMFMVISGCGSDNNTSTQPTQDMSVLDMRDMSGREEMGCEGNTCGDQGLDTCGDGMRTGDEECDDGNLTSGDGCSDTCQKESVQSVCGDGMKTGDEACDEGPNPDAACSYGEMSCDVCTSECALVAGTVSYCGDGILQDDEGELCDDGGQNSDDGPCLPDCSRIVPVKMVGGFRNSYLLMSNGTIYTWGANDYGQLGDGTTTSRSQPALLPRFKNVVDLVGGRQSMCALLENGEVWCIGRGDDGELGHGLYESSSSPVQVGLSVNVVTLSGYGRRYCAIDSLQDVWCWGLDNVGGLGTPGDAMNQASPVKVTLPAPVKLMTSGIHSCALLESNEVWCWGGKRYYYGEEDTFVVDRAPEHVADLDQAKSLYAMTQALLFKNEDGEVYGVGENRSNELNTPTKDMLYYEPIAIDNIDSSYTIFTSGNAHVCAISSEEELFCWGNNSFRQLSEEMPGIFFMKVNIDAVKHVGTGGRHTCAIDGNHDVWCWGSNAEGQLGFEASEDLFGPQKVNLWPTP